MMLTPTLLNFTPIGINYCNNIRNNNIQFKGLHLKNRELVKDTFETASRIIYKEKDYNEIKTAVKKENFIGAGFEGRVFQMKDPQYVVKLPKDFFNGKKIDNIKVQTDLTEEEVTNQDKINHIVKKYKNGITIMKKIPGKQIETKEEMNEAADLPVKCYQKLLNQIIDAESEGMEFDFAMNNVLYDKKTGSLTAIDFRPFKEGKRKFNPLEKMYFAFDCFKQPHEKKVAGKILSAALNNLKSNADNKKSQLNYDFYEILRILQYNHPECLGKIIDIQKYIQTIKTDRITAQDSYQLNQLDNYIHYTKELITTI